MCVCVYVCMYVLCFSISQLQQYKSKHGNTLKADKKQAVKKRYRLKDMQAIRCTDINVIIICMLIAPHSFLYFSA